MDMILTLIIFFRRLLQKFIGKPGMSNDTKWAKAMEPEDVGPVAHSFRAPNLCFGGKADCCCTAKKQACIR
jgi:hypothetical protein